MTAARERWVDHLPRIVGRVVPDAITASIAMLALLFATALALGNSLAKTLDAWYQGLWMLLPFTMQMTLIIVLSSVVGQTPFFTKTIVALSRLPRSPNQVVIGAVLLGAFLSYLYWGLGMALSPIIAIHFAKEAERKRIEVDFLFLLAVVTASNAAWQFGFSASAPLLVATPGHFLESIVGVLPLATTIWTPAAILHEFLFVLALIAVGCRLMPKNCRPLSMFPEAGRQADPAAAEEVRTGSFSETLEQSPMAAWLFCAALAGWLWVHFRVRRLSLDINSLNAFFLLLAFLLHGNVRRFTQAMQQAIVSSWPVVVIYHLYAGVAGLIQFTTVGERFAGLLAAVSTRYTFPLLTAISATVVSLFVPSSGGQWAIQGFVTSKAALALGVSVQRGLLALSVGDHMGNLLSPFWYTVAAGIARVSFRDFIGYGIIFALIWFGIGVPVFTFAPC